MKVNLVKKNRPSQQDWRIPTVYSVAGKRLALFEMGAWFIAPSIKNAPCPKPDKGHDRLAPGGDYSL
jgi:hypothetical protein